MTCNSKAMAITCALRDGLRYYNHGNREYQEYVLFENLAELWNDYKRRVPGELAVQMDTLQVYERTGNQWILSTCKQLNV